MMDKCDNTCKMYPMGEYCIDCKHYQEVEKGDKKMICDMCTCNNPKYWAWSYKLEEYLPICEGCFQKYAPTKWEYIEKG